MIRQFDLLALEPGRAVSFVGEATMELQVAGAREAIAAMRHCAASGPTYSRRMGRAPWAVTRLRDRPTNAKMLRLQLLRW
jgi:hypothetical protein